VAGWQQRGKSPLNRNASSALNLWPRGHSEEDLILPQRTHGQRRFLAIGFLDIDGHAADMFM
jgi:hypothetical protein